MKAASSQHSDQLVRLKSNEEDAEMQPGKAVVDTLCPLLWISTEFHPLADLVQHHVTPSVYFPFSLLSLFSPFPLWVESGNWWRKKMEGS